MNMLPSIQNYLALLMSQESTKAYRIRVLYKYFIILFSPFLPTRKTEHRHHLLIMQTTAAAQIILVEHSQMCRLAEMMWRALPFPAACADVPTLVLAPKLTDTWTKRSIFRIFPSYFLLTSEVLTLLKKKNKRLWCQYGVRGVCLVCGYGGGRTPRQEELIMK